MSECSEPKNDNSSMPLNPRVFLSRFQHITEKIFEKMDIKTLRNCRQVSTTWQEFIDNHNIIWKNETGTKAFQRSCQFYHTKLAGILIKNSKRFNIKISSTPVLSGFDPMVFSGRYQHIKEKIFEKISINSLKNCRKVSTLWQEFIDDQNIGYPMEK